MCDHERDTSKQQGQDKSASEKEGRMGEMKNGMEAGFTV